MWHCFDLCCVFSSRTTLWTGLIMAPGRLSHRVSKVPANMKMTSTGRWMTGVHVNMANVTFFKWLWLSTANRAAWAWVPTPPSISLPLIVCAFIFFSLYSLRGVCVRSGSFKHCSKSIALIKGITSQKRGEKTQAALRSSVKLEKARYTEQMFVTLQTTIPERLSERQQKKDKPAKIKERKERYVFTISPAFSVYRADDESYCFGPASVHLASKSHWLVTVVGSDPYFILAHAYMQICACVQYVYR